jgi:hypothetical protein
MILVALSMKGLAPAVFIATKRRIKIGMLFPCHSLRGKVSQKCHKEKIEP